MTTTTIDERLQAGRATTAEALAIFDALDTVDVDFMCGAWRGEGFHTDHPLDGILEAYYWHGKRFDSPEDVHPLVFAKANGQLVSVNPAFMAPTLNRVETLPIPKSALAGRTFRALLPLMSTKKSKARLRLTDYRGKTSATMIYDDLPIHDVFRKIDDDSVFGLMDLKTMQQPFFFVLRRDRPRNAAAGQSGGIQSR